MKVVISILLVLMFVGCSSSFPRIEMKEYEPLPVSYRYSSHDKKVTVDANVFEAMLNRLINIRIDNNICAKTFNKYIDQ